MKDACELVTEAVIDGIVEVKEAWDNLDSGLKQWIINGVGDGCELHP